MSEAIVGIDGRSLMLGVCRRCEFVWFEAAEYESISTAAPKPKDPWEAVDENLPQAAREAIALYKAQRIAEQARESDPEPDDGWKNIPAFFGMPVEMDSAPLACVPWATISLAALIAAVSIPAFFDLKNAVGQFGLIPNDAWRYGGLTFLTSFFLHAGVIHLASNLYFLIIFGIQVENCLGWKRWLLLVALAAGAGNVLHLLAGSRGQLPLVGASGGISGLVAFYALKFPHARLGIMFRYFFAFKWVQFPAWAAFILWMLLQFWGAYKQIAGFSNVSALAHLGGAAVGVLLWAAWRKTESQPAATIPAG
jgi:membrane associated rhomboid family serine protease